MKDHFPERQTIEKGGQSKMEITWEGIVCLFLCLVVGSIIAACIETAAEDRKRRREQAEREELQRRGGEGHNENEN